MDTDAIVISAFVYAAICGPIGALIGNRKNLGAATGFIFGFCLGVIGLIILWALRPGLPPAPEGMRAIRCPRCNADQNVSKTATASECWQCKQKIALSGSTARAGG